MQIKYTILRCLAPHPVERVKHEAHRAKITTLDGVWLPTGRVVQGNIALEQHPGPDRALAWCSKCKASTEYKRAQP